MQTIDYVIVRKQDRERRIQFLLSLHKVIYNSKVHTEK